MEKIIGLGGLAISSCEGDTLKTYALGTCVGVTVYSYEKKTAGMVHVVLPTPESDAEPERPPAYYATTGVLQLIAKMCHQFGCTKNSLEIHLFGGSELIHSRDIFKVGQRNVAAVENTLNKLQLRYHSLETGGCYSRTVAIDVHSGEIRLNKQLCAMF